MNNQIEFEEDLKYIIEDETWTIKKLAKELIDLGYQKIDKDKQVVLTREEYGEYIELRNSEVGELVKENRELGRRCMDWIKSYRGQLTKTDKACKETAQTILNKCDKLYYQYMSADFAFDVFKKWITEQYGVEVNND